MERVSVIKKLLFFVLFWFGLDFTAGQDTVTLEGYVRDTSGRAVPYATVALWRIPEEVGEMTVDKALSEGWGMTGGGVSDTGGYYRVASLEPGRYLLECKHIVYKAARKELEVGKGPVEGDFILYPNSEILAELKVEGSRLRYTAGEYKINLSESEMVRNRTMSEALNFLPGLEYKDGKLRLDGREVSVIYLDGRELRDADQLRWLKGEDMEEVEVQNQAGSAYSSTLKGGIVRIRTKREEGYSLDLILNPYYTPAKTEGYGGSFVVPFSLRVGKFSLTNEARYRHHTGDAIENEEASYMEEGYRLKKEQHSTLRYNLFKDYLSMVYDIDGKTSVGIVGAFFYNASKNKVRSVSIPEMMPGHETEDIGYKKSGYSLDEDSKNLSYLLAVDYSQIFDSLGSRLSVKADYLYNSLRRNTLYRTEWFGWESSFLGEDTYRQYAPLTENNTTARLAYHHGFRSGRGLDVGLTYDGKFAVDVFRTEVFRNGEWQNDPEQGDRYGIQTNQATAYAIYTDSYGKFSYSLGASVQWDGLLSKDAEANLFSERNYVQPFANLSFGYNFNAQRGTSLNLDLSRYSGKMPTYQQLSPRPVRISEKTYMGGNERLRLPSGYRGQLTYMLRGAWRFVYSFSAGKDAIYNIASYDPVKEITWQRPQNGNWEYEHALSINWEKELNRWLYMGLGGQALYVDQSFYDNTGTYRNKAAMGVVFANLNFQVLPTMGIGLNLFYNTPMDLISERYNHDLTGSLSLYKTFFDGSLYLGMECYFRGWDIKVKTWELDGSYQTTIRYYNPFVQSLDLTVRWRFSRNSQNFKTIQTIQRIED